MNLFIIIFGLLFVALGFLLKAYPNLIVGYKVGQNDNIDIKKLSVFLRNSFIVEGVLVIIGYYILKKGNLNTLADLIIMLPMLGLLFILPWAQHYDNNRIKQNFTPITVITVTLFCVGIFTPGLFPARVTISAEAVSISGMYSTDINMSDIEKVELVKYLPRITMKTNGFALGAFCKGYFDLNKWGNCKLFLGPGAGPYLVITDKEGAKTIINNKDSTVTINDYSQIAEKIKKE